MFFKLMLIAFFFILTCYHDGV